MASATKPAAIETAHVSGRRRVQFNNTKEVLADAENLAARGYRQLGNWSLGQICKHLAIGTSMPMDGTSVKPPWIVRWIASTFVKPRAMRDGLKPGFKLSARAAKEFIPDPVSDAEGIEALRQMTARWQTHGSNALHGHPFFGKLTREEWDKMMRHHAALHLSFLLPN